MTEFTEALPRATESVHTARRLVAAHSGELTVTRAEDAGLMVSELVTNALMHGKGLMTVRITSEPGQVTVEVADEGHGDVVVAPVPGAAGGWGLRIVAALADSWGTEQGSTRVWFSIARGDL